MYDHVRSVGYTWNFLRVLFFDLRLEKHLLVSQPYI